MSADAWKTCPRCYNYVKELFEKHKDNEDSPLNFEEVKQLELLKEGFDVGYPRNISETDIDKDILIDIEDKLDEVDRWDGIGLLPSEDNLRPVEIRYQYGVDEDGAWFSLYAECCNCGRQFEVEQR